MPTTGRARRGRTLVTTLALALAVTGCASDGGSSPAPDPTVAEPSSTVAPTDSDGITTTSDVYPEWEPINGLAVPGKPRALAPPPPVRNVGRIYVSAANVRMVNWVTSRCTPGSADKISRCSRS